MTGTRDQWALLLTELECRDEIDVLRRAMSDGDFRQRALSFIQRNGMLPNAQTGVTPMAILASVAHTLKVLRTASAVQ